MEDKKCDEIRNGANVILDVPIKLLIVGPGPLNEQYILSVNSSTTVSELRQDIATYYEYSNPSDIDLRWNDQMLLANKTIGYYKIKEGDVIVVAERIASRLHPVKSRKDSQEVAIKPFQSPTSKRKGLKEGSNKFDDSYSIQLKSGRSESMPDLSLPSPETKRKKLHKDLTRKISTPIFAGKYERVNHLPTLPIITS